LAERRRLVIATGNTGKLREYRELLADSGFELVAFDSGADEVGETYAENARLKRPPHDPAYPRWETTRAWRSRRWEAFPASVQPASGRLKKRGRQSFSDGSRASLGRGTRALSA